MRGIILTILLTLFVTSNAQDYAVVVASDSEVGMLDADRIKDIFLRRRHFNNEVRLVPVNLLGDEMPRIDFEVRVLQMDRSALNRYWIANHFQGISPPTTQASLDSIKRFVERVNGAISYLPLSMVDDSMKVVHEF